MRWDTQRHLRHHDTHSKKTQTHQESTLRVEGVGATHIYAPVAQELQQTYVVVAISLQRATNHMKREPALT